MNEAQRNEESGVAKRSIFYRVVISLRCWWLGCEPHLQDTAPAEYLSCMHCGEYMCYEKLCGGIIGTYYQLKRTLAYWLFSRWWPSKCVDCKKRYGDHSQCIPF